MVGYAFEEDDDRRSVRSTSTVASTAGTGALSLASRMSALHVDFSDKLALEMTEGGGAEGQAEQSIIEEEEEYGARSERTMNTAVTGDGDGEEVEGEAEEVEDTDEDAFSTRPLGMLLGQGEAMESPDSHHSFSQRSPFQICSRIFAAKGNILLKRMTIRQVEELRQHGYVVIDNFVSRELAEQVQISAVHQYSKGRMTDAPWSAADARSGRAVGSDHVMPLLMGKPPADSSPMATLLVAMQELYDDLAEFVRLRRTIGEYQVSLHQAGSQGVPRHRDALPDSGRKQGRSRVTCLVCCSGDVGSNGGEDSGAVSIWPPRRVLLGGASERQHLRSLHPHLHQSSSMNLRRSLTGSEGGNSFSESDTCSLRSHHIGAAAGAGGLGTVVGGSISSSLWAEAASALDPREDGNASVDNMSMNESLDGAMLAAVGYAAAAAAGSLLGPNGGGMGSATSSSQLPGSAAALAVAEARALAWSAALGLQGLQQPRDAPQDPAASAAGGTAVNKGIEWVEAEGEMVLRVAPLPGRLVVFLSGAVDHAHQPMGASVADLVSVTAWYQ